MPGERGQACYAQRVHAGIPMPMNLIKELSELANARGMTVPW